MKTKLFGANAKVFLNFNGELEDIAKILSDKLDLPKFGYKSDIDPPHSICAMTETLCFETWLYESDEFEHYSFVFEVESGMAVEDKFINELFDLSPWLAKEITRICDIETYFQA